MTIYNAKPWIEDLVFTKGDTINTTLEAQLYNEVTDQWDDFILTGKQIDIDVCKCDGTLIRSFSSAGGSPDITILLNAFLIYNLTPFTRKGKYKYDVQVTDGSDVYTIMKGNLYVQEEMTT